MTFEVITICPFCSIYHSGLQMSSGSLTLKYELISRV